MTPRKLYAQLTRIEVDADYAPDFRRLVSDARQALHVAMARKPPRAPELPAKAPAWARAQAWNTYWDERAKFESHPSVEECAREAARLLQLWDVGA
jgi:hypothetical protein